MSPRHWEDLRFQRSCKWHILVRTCMCHLFDSGPFVSCNMNQGPKMKEELLFLFLQLCQPLTSWSNQTTGFAMGHSQQLQMSSIRYIQFTLSPTASTCLSCMPFFLIKWRKLSKTNEFPSGYTSKTCNNGLRNFSWEHKNASEHNKKLEFGEHIRLMLCTAFLPVKDVSTEVEKLQSTCPEDCKPFFNYFADNYVGQKNSTGQRPKLRFAIESWNCFERIKKAIQKQTTLSTAGRVFFAKLLKTKLPSISKLYEKFKEEQNNHN